MQLWSWLRCPKSPTSRSAARATSGTGPDRPPLPAGGASPGATVGLVISPTQPTWRLGSNVTTITIGRDGS
jgi:hypothetical protein